MNRLQPNVFDEIARSLIPLANSPIWLKVLWVEKELEEREIWNVGVTELIRPYLSPEDPWDSELQLDDLTSEQAELASLIHILAVSKRLNSSPVRRLPRVEPLASPVTTPETATPVEADVVLWSESRRTEGEIRSEFALSSDTDKPAQISERADLPVAAKSEADETDVTDCDNTSPGDATVQVESDSQPVVMWSESRRPESEIRVEFEYSMHHSEPVQPPKAVLQDAEVEGDERGETIDLPEFDIASWSTPWAERDELRDWSEADTAVTSIEETLTAAEELLPVAQSPDAAPVGSNDSDIDVESDVDQLETDSSLHDPSFENGSEYSRPAGVETPSIVDVDHGLETEPEEIDTPVSASTNDAAASLDAETGDEKSVQQDAVVSPVVAEDSSVSESGTLEVSDQPVVNTETPEVIAEKDAQPATTIEPVSHVQKTRRKAKPSRKRTTIVKADKRAANSKSARKPRKKKPVVAEPVVIEPVVAETKIGLVEQVPVASVDVATPKQDQAAATESESTAPAIDVQPDAVKPQKKRIAQKKRTASQRKRTESGKSKRVSKPAPAPIAEIKPVQAEETVAEKVTESESVPVAATAATKSVASVKKTRKPARGKARTTRSTVARTARAVAKPKKSEATQPAPLKLLKPAVSKAVASTTKKTRKSASTAKTSEANSPVVKLGAPQSHVIPFTESVAEQTDTVEQGVASTAQDKTTRRKKAPKLNRPRPRVVKSRKATASRPKPQELQQPELADTQSAEMADAAGVADFYGLHIDDENETDRGKLLFFDSVIKTYDGDWNSNGEQLESVLESLDDSVQSRIWKQAIEQSLKIRRKLDRPDAA